ncbi:MAG: OmpA family protein [Rhodanobacter sp.]
MQSAARWLLIASCSSTLLWLAGCTTSGQLKPAPPVAAVHATHIDLSTDTLFAFGKADLRAGADDSLHQLASKLRLAEKIESVKIFGYSDRVGTPDYNKSLSQRRADSVRDYLINQGVAPALIQAEGRGEDAPVVVCANRLRGKKLQACLAPNRRVEVDIVALN